MIVFDVTNQTYFNNIDKWYFEIKEKASKNINLMLIRNKTEEAFYDLIKDMYKILLKLKEKSEQKENRKEEGIKINIENKNISKKKEILLNIKIYDNGY